MDSPTIFKGKFEVAETPHHFQAKFLKECSVSQRFFLPVHILYMSCIFACMFVSYELAPLAKATKSELAMVAPKVFPAAVNRRLYNGYS